MTLFHNHKILYVINLHKLSRFVKTEEIVECGFETHSPSHKSYKRVVEFT